jgi:hypothetical protein
MAVREKAYYVVRADDLADWIERQPEMWWTVDGDPDLKGVVDFPCPSNELAPEIRRVGKNLLMQDKFPSAGEDEVVEGRKLDELTIDYGRHHVRAFYLAWEDSDIPWLLMEDKDAVRLFGTGQ